MNKFPSPDYLLGSLAADEVEPELALGIARAYAEANAEGMSDDQRHQWLRSMWSRLGERNRGNTGLAVFAYPSEHDTPRLHELAREYGWKGNN